MEKFWSLILEHNLRNMVLASVAILLFFISNAFAEAEENGNIQYHYVCPKNFERVGRKCYHFSNASTTWFQAYFSCRDLDSSNLTVLAERYDQRSLEQYLFKNRSKHKGLVLSSFWVGGFKDWKQKRWIWGTDGEPVQFPTSKDIDLNRKGEWTCLLIDASVKKWRAENCMNQTHYICETESKTYVAFKLYDKKFKRKISIDKCISGVENLTKKQMRKCQKMLHGRNGVNKHTSGPAAVIQKAYPTRATTVKFISHICPQSWMSLGNKCYLLSKDEATWSEAHFNCGQINAKLAMIRSKAQDQKLRIFLNGFTERRERWIGGRYNSRRREWIWALNGNKLKYRGFAKEAQRNMTGKLDWQAIIMDPQYAYQWSFRNEMERKYYICQVKGRSVKGVNSPKKPAATIQILSEKRNQRRNRENKRSENN